MCVNPIEIVKNIIDPPKPKPPKVVVQNPGPDPETMKELKRQREELNKQREEFLKQQQQFNKDQQKWLEEQKQRQAAPVVAPVVERRQSAPLTASETEQAVASRRRGRSSLRIRLSATNSGAGNTGLNVPRG